MFFWKERMPNPGKVPGGHVGPSGGLDGPVGPGDLEKVRAANRNIGLRGGAVEGVACGWGIEVGSVVALHVLWVTLEHLVLSLLVEVVGAGRRVLGVRAGYKEKEIF